MPADATGVRQGQKRVRQGQAGQAGSDQDNLMFLSENHAQDRLVGGFKRHFPPPKCPSKGRPRQCITLVRLALQTPLESLNPHFQAPNGLFKAGFAPQIPVLLEPIQPLALVRPPSAQHRKRGHRAAIAVVEAIVRREVAVPEY